MAEITAALVKELRSKTGAGMMDCKKALAETGGDIEAAVDWLRKQGLAAAAKKAGRVAAEGLVAVLARGGRGAIVEVNSETDFVARNEQFQDLVRNVVEAAEVAHGDLDKTIAAAYPGKSVTVGEEITNMIATIGENISLRRAAAVSVEPGIVAGYTHNAVAPGLGKIGVLVALESTGDEGKLMEVGKQVAMHVAAAGPLAVTPEALDPAVIERERAVLAAQAKESGKPDEIVQKMVEGRLRKFYQDVVLLEQTFVIDGENTVKKALEMAAKDVGAPIKVSAFVRFALGEGVEKKSTDFAAEVAATAAS